MNFGVIHPEINFFRKNNEIVKISQGNEIYKVKGNLKRIQLYK
jgi:hypothetical protein